MVCNTSIHRFKSGRRLYFPGNRWFPGFFFFKIISRKNPATAGFSACGGSLQRHNSPPPQCDPARRAFYFTGKFNEVSCKVKKLPVLFASAAFLKISFFLIFFFFHIVFVHIRRFSLIRNFVPSVLFSEHFHFFPCRQSSDDLACADVGFCTYIDR